MSSIQEEGAASNAAPGDPPSPTSPCDFLIERQMAAGFAAMPEVGTDFLGFHLVDELGRGAFSRVFLAQQADLADRPVVLKVAVGPAGEPQMLARLQHTNIVPIYSAHHAGPLHAVCMPYFGPTTLAAVLKDLRNRTGQPESGAALVSSLHHTVIQGSAPPTAPPHPLPESGPPLKKLQAMNYVEAVLWIGARLADGLAHAHERGILHRDLKPANVLLGDDGQPMLLDLNLAQDMRSGSPQALVGGTLAYMSPEQLRAFLGEPGARETCDARSDLFGLGVILFELLSGTRPYPDRPGELRESLPRLLEDRLRPPPRLCGTNRAITPAVEAIVRRCLEPFPRRRYQTAQQLREDIECQLANLPLRHKPEPSLRERVRKWARRHPRLASPGSVFALALMALALWAIPAAWQAAHRASEQADARVQQVEQEAGTRTRQAEEKAEQKADQKGKALEQFVRFRDESQIAWRLEDELNLMELLNEGGPSKRKTLNRSLARARQALDRFGILTDPEWQKSQPAALLPTDMQNELRAGASEVLWMLARVERFELARARHRASAYSTAMLALRPWAPRLVAWDAFEAILNARAQQALRLNELAAACLSRDIVAPGLQQQRIALARLLDESPRAGVVPAVGERRRPETARELYRSAAEAASEGRYMEAVTLLDDSTLQDPQHFSSWLLLAVCHERLRQYKEAGARWSICIALRPDFAWGYFYRGHTYLRRHLWDEARKDFDEVLKLRTDLWPAYLGRAVALDKLTRTADALEDLNRALKEGRGSIDAYALRAQLRADLGDKEGAKQDRAAVLKMQPDSADAWLTRGLVQAKENGKKDVRAALADIDRALQLEPRFQKALLAKVQLLVEPHIHAEEAVKALNQLLEQYPDDHRSRLTRGFVLAWQGKREEAHRDAEYALRVDDTPRAHYDAGVIYAVTAAKEPSARERARDHERALDLLAYALRNGYGQEHFARDVNLLTLHQHPRFKRMKTAIQDLGGGKRSPQQIRPDP